jgi:hypothetical protein
LHLRSPPPISSRLGAFSAAPPRYGALRESFA